jgi:S-(hydroxymethyl)glutathione dehydrogenase/alcohol dehydrogenase
MRARAVVVRDRDGDAALEEIEVEAPRVGEVLVRVVASGICGSDLHVVHGRSVLDAFPMVLGHEGAGVVEAVGDGVTTVQPGDHVVLALYGPCHTCASCRAGRFVLCDGAARVAAIAGRMADGGTRLHAGGAPVYPMVGVGSLAERAVLRAEQMVKVDPQLPLQVVCLAGCGVTTGLGSVFNVADVQPGESVAVVGCGGVGLNVVQGAVLAGAATIVGVDVAADKAALARDFGATHAVVPDGGDLTAAVLDVVPGGVDYAFDVTGVPGVLAAAFNATRDGGTTVMVGSPPSAAPIEIPPQKLFFSRTLRGCSGGDAVPARDLPMLVDLYLAGRLRLDALITERGPLDDVNGMIERVRAGKVARAVITL